MYRNILIPTDGSRLSEAAAEAGIRLGRALGARVTIVHVVADAPISALEAWAHDGDRYPERIEKSFASRALLMLEQVRDAALRAGVRCDCHIIQGGIPHAEILKAAAQYDCDLIVMASHRLGAEPAVLLDGETMKVLTGGPVPVLVHH